jgi:hypothetical protein
MLFPEIEAAGDQSLAIPFSLVMAVD